MDTLHPRLRLQLNPYTVTWYRSLGSKPQFSNEFETNPKRNENKEIVVTDFNCNMLNSQTNNDINTRTLLDLIDMYQLRQHINTATRSILKTQTLINIIITKIDDTKIILFSVTVLGIIDK